MAWKIGIVVSRFNDMITEKLLQGTLEQLSASGVNAQDIAVVHVPGAVEIPLTAQLMAKQKRYHAIICLGAVIRGDTPHFDYVSQQVSQGCQRVMMDHDIPVIFGVLTTDNMEQAIARIGGKVGHKGKEAAEAAMEMIRVIQNLVPA